MTRYLLAGLAMTASVVLLFLASFKPAGLVGTRQDGSSIPLAAPAQERVAPVQDRAAPIQERAAGLGETETGRVGQGLPRQGTASPGSGEAASAVGPAQLGQTQTSQSPLGQSPLGQSPPGQSPPGQSLSAQSRAGQTQVAQPHVEQGSGPAVQQRPGERASMAAGQSEEAKAVAALQEQIRKAAQTLASLETQVTQTRQDLASLKTQKGQGSPLGQQGAPQGPAPVARQALGQAQTGQVQPGSTRSSDAGQGNGRGAGVDTGARAEVQSPSSPSLDRSQPGSTSRRQEGRPNELRSADARTADAPGELRTPRATSSAEVRGGEEDTAQAALSRLRRQSASGPVVAARPDGMNEPHRIPTIERLQDARAAVIEGRMEDARRFLQAAQVQLVFRPVGPGQEQPRISQATGPLSQALLALSTGDRGRAIVAIDQAAGALDPGSQSQGAQSQGARSQGARAQQFGSLPQGGSESDTFLAPVPRAAP